VAVACSALARSPVQVPFGKTPQLDGTIEPDEWQDASRQPLTGGGELYLKTDGESLYIAIRGSANGWSHVYLGDRFSVYVLHASAALGDARYERQRDQWSPARQFTWEMRNSKDRTPEEKSAYLASHGWLANSVDRGAQREYRIPLSLLRSRRIAVVFASDPAVPQYWPSSLKDGTLAGELLRGTVPAGVTFDTSQWAELKFAHGH
jgi:hypothetical protein